MGRATTKSDLINSANESIKKIWDFIDSMSTEELDTSFDFSGDVKKKEAHWSRDKNLRDILTHLYEWHCLLLNWIELNTNGEGGNFLPESYNWKNYGELNLKFWEKHQSTTLDKAKTILVESHKMVMELLEMFTNEELFSKGYYSWTGTTSLGSYCVSSTASHYEWALKKLKAHRRKLKG